jgi:hypothetical protein
MGVGNSGFYGLQRHGFSNSLSALTLIWIGSWILIMENIKEDYYVNYHCKADPSHESSYVQHPLTQAD